MDDFRKSMKEALAVQVIPTLRKTGFIGSFPHFRRIRGEITDLITFQLDKHGGGFVIEIAQHHGAEYKTHWGKIIELKKLTAHDLHPDQRKRIQADDNTGNTESWFRYDNSKKSDRFTNVAKLVVEKLDIDNLFK